MRPKTITVTSGNSPYYIPVDFRSGETGIVATPNSGNYDVAYTLESIAEGAAGVTNWVDVDDMSAATTQATGTVQTATCLRVTLNSGTSVTVDISTKDV